MSDDPIREAQQREAEERGIKLEEDEEDDSDSEEDAIKKRNKQDSSEEEDSEEEEEEEKSSSKKKKKKKIKGLFVDEASEGSSGEDGFEAEPEEDDLEQETLTPQQIALRAARLEEERAFLNRDENDIARDVQQRYQATKDVKIGTGAKFGGAATIETARLMRERPRTEDPKLFMVKCKPGEEKHLILKLYSKYIRDKYKKPEPIDPNAPKSRWSRPLPAGAELEIYSVLSPGTAGYIYVESMREDCVKAAIRGVSGIFSKISIVPIEEMQDVLRVELRKDVIRKDDYVRLKGPFPYKGDLAKVFSVVDGGNKVTVRVVPRIDLSNISNEFSDEKDLKSKNDKKNKSIIQKIIPPAKLFNPDEIRAVGGAPEREIYPTLNKMMDKLDKDFFENGLMYMDVNQRQIQNINVNPRVEELEKFIITNNANTNNVATSSSSSGAANGNNDNENNNNSSGDNNKIQGNGDNNNNNKDDVLIAEEMQKTLNKQKKEQYDFSVGDMVQVISGTDSGLAGQLENVDLLRSMGMIKSDTMKIEVRLKDLVKKFQVGDHIKVALGKHAGKSGNVVSIISSQNSKPSVIVYTDLGGEEIQVFNNEMKISSEVSIGLDSLNGYRLYDLVMLDQNQHGIIVRVNSDTLRILTQNGEAKEISPTAIRAKRNMENRHATTMDVNHHNLSQNDHVVIINGPFKGVEGMIRHIYRTLLFVHSKSREHENAGMIVVKSREARIAGSLQKASVTPSLYGGGSINRSSHSSSRGGKREEFVGKTVRIKKGNDKGLVGIIVEGGSTESYRIELNARNRIINVLKENVVFEEPKLIYESQVDHQHPHTNSNNPFRSSSNAAAFPATPMQDNSNYQPLHSTSTTNNNASGGFQIGSSFQKNDSVKLIDTGESATVYEVVDRDIVVIGASGKMKIVAASNVVYA